MSQFIDDLLKEIKNNEKKDAAFQTCYSLLDFTTINYYIDSFHIIGDKNLSWLRPLMKFSCPLKLCYAVPCRDKKIKRYPKLIILKSIKINIKC